MAEIRGVGVEWRSPGQEIGDLTNRLVYQESPNLERDLRNRHLGLSRTRVGDAGLASLAGLHDLEFLSLDGTQVSDTGLASLAGLHKLFTLSLDETRVTDAGLKQVARLPGLVRLDLHGTDVTAKGIAALKEKNPTMEIEH